MNCKLAFAAAPESTDGTTGAGFGEVSRTADVGVRTKDGFGAGLRSAMGMVKNHPILAGANAATIAASAGVCPYLSGLSVNIANTLPLAQGINAVGIGNDNELPLL